MEKLTLKVGKAITPTKELEEVAIVIEEGKIKKIVPWDSVDDDALNYPEAIACPGFVNIHMHGYAGCDATSGDPEDLLEIAESITENGVTTILPTTMSDSQDNLLEAAEAFKEAKRRKTKELIWQGYTLKDLTLELERKKEPRTQKSYVSLM